MNEKLLEFVPKADVVTTEKTIEAVNDQRLKLARELHDEFAQNLTAMMLQTYAIKDENSDLKLIDKIDVLHALVDKSARQLRCIINDLRSINEPKITFESLSSKVSQLKKFWNMIDTELEIKLTFDGNITTVGDHVDVAYKILQEAITNIFRHARASKIEVNIYVDDDFIHMNVSDDGVGMLKPDLDGSSGLQGMQERIKIINGSLRFASQRQGGTKLLVKIPLSQA